MNPAFGTEADLVQLSAALHARGMVRVSVWGCSRLFTRKRLILCQYLMVDIVTNHMAYMGCGTCVDYSQFNPFSSVSSAPPTISFDEDG